MSERYEDEYNKLIKMAQEQPGILELMQIYGQYEELLRISNAYLANTNPEITIVTTNSTS